MAYDYRPSNPLIGKPALIAGLNPELALLGLAIAVIVWLVLGIFGVDWVLKLVIIFIMVASVMALTGGGIWKFVGQFWKPRRYIVVPVSHDSPLSFLLIGQDEYRSRRNDKTVDSDRIRQQIADSRRKVRLAQNG